MQFPDVRGTIDHSQYNSSPRLKAPFAFVHIPKCSGTAFENYMISQGGGFETSRAFTGLGRNDIPESLETYFENEAASPFVFGHFYYRHLRKFCPGAFTATFVRDPVARTISQYKSWNDEKNFHPDDPHYKVANPLERDALVFAQQASLEDFVCSDNPVIRDGALGNQQTLYLSTHLGENMEDHLDSAKKNLASLDFFGITENFDQSLDLLRSIISDLSDYKVDRQMENRSRVTVQAISERAMEVIAQQVEYDRRLYDYACQLFKSRLAEGYSGSKHRYSVKWFSRKNESETNAVKILALEAENREVELACEQLRAQLAQVEIARIHASEENQRALEVQQARTMDAEAESNLLRAQLVHLEACHVQLQQVYTDIVGSRSWRLIQALQSILGRLRSK